eukprot:gene361-6515_t
MLAARPLHRFEQAPDAAQMGGAAGALPSSGVATPPAGALVTSILGSGLSPSGLSPSFASFALGGKLPLATLFRGLNKLPSSVIAAHLRLSDKAGARPPAPALFTVRESMAKSFSKESGLVYRIQREPTRGAADSPPAGAGAASAVRASELRGIVLWHISAWPRELEERGARARGLALRNGPMPPRPLCEWTDGPALREVLTAPFSVLRARENCFEDSRMCVECEFVECLLTSERHAAFLDYVKRQRRTSDRALFAVLRGGPPSAAAAALRGAATPPPLSLQGPGPPQQH